MSIIWALVNHVLKTIGLPCALKAVPEGLPAAFKKWHQAAYISSLYCIIIIMSGKTHFIITLVSSNVDGEDWIRLLCEECEYVSQTESHRETDRQTKGRMRVILVFCQNDSVVLLSFSPQPLTDDLCHLDEFRLTTCLGATHTNFIFTRHILESDGLLSPPLCCLSVFCLSVSNKSLS